MYKTKKRLIIKNRVRFTLFIILAAALVNVAVFAFMLPGRTSADISHKTELVSVAPGDSLWSIASTYVGDNSDVRDMIYRIKKLNNLSSADLLVGQTISVPLD